jgi:hypothetical protein
MESGLAGQPHQFSLITNRQVDRAGAACALCKNTLFHALSVTTQKRFARHGIDRAGRIPEHAQFTRLSQIVSLSVRPRVSTILMRVLHSLE